MKEEKQTSTSKVFAEEDKLDEMTSIIKDFAAKMSKLELENRNTRKVIHEARNKNPTPYR